MTDRYDPHRAHPDTVLQIVQWMLDGGQFHPHTPVGKLTTMLRDQCRIDPDADLLRAAKAYFVKFFQPGDVNVEWAELELAGRRAVLATAASPAVIAPTPNSGPPGAAAKESREDIAAPGGATQDVHVEDVACSDCQRPMARVAGPSPGWTCVNCNSAGDPEDDHPEDPERPCGCEETEALKAEVERLRMLTEDTHAPNTLEWRKMVDDLRSQNYDLALQLSRIRKLKRTLEVQNLFEEIEREP